MLPFLNCFGQLVLLAIVLTPAVSAAQKPKVVWVSFTEIRGHVVGVGKGFLLVKSLGGQPWNITVAKAARVQVTGKANSDLLVPGKFVRFTASIDKRQGRATEKVKQLTVFVPQRNRPEYTPGAQPASGENSDTGIDTTAGPGPLPSLPRATQGSAKRSPAKSAGGESFDIRAQIVSFKKGKLVVAVQSPYLKPKLTLDLADDVAVDFDLIDYTLAKPGDEITARGLSIVVGKAEVFTVVIHRTDGQAGDGKKQEASPPVGQAGKPADPAKPAEPGKPADPAAQPSDEVEQPAPLK